MAKDPPPRLSDKQVQGVSRALDIWALIGNHSGETHMSDNIFYDEEATGYAKKGELFCSGSQRGRNFAHFDRVPRDEWANREFFGRWDKATRQRVNFSTLWCVTADQSTTLPSDDKRRKRVSLVILSKTCWWR